MSYVRSCPICQNTAGEDTAEQEAERGVRGTCGHYCHIDCLKAKGVYWIRNNFECPVCRRPEAYAGHHTPDELAELQELLRIDILRENAASEEANRLSAQEIQQMADQAINDMAPQMMAAQNENAEDDVAMPDLEESDDDTVPDMSNISLLSPPRSPGSSASSGSGTAQSSRSSSAGSSTASSGSGSAQSSSGSSRSSSAGSSTASSDSGSSAGSSDSGSSAGSSPGPQRRSRPPPPRPTYHSTYVPRSIVGRWAEQREYERDQRREDQRERGLLCVDIAESTGEPCNRYGTIPIAGLVGRVCTDHYKKRLIGTQLDEVKVDKRLNKILKAEADAKQKLALEMAAVTEEALDLAARVPQVRDTLRDLTRDYRSAQRALNRLRQTPSV